MHKWNSGDSAVRVPRNVQVIQELPRWFAEARTVLFYSFFSVAPTNHAAHTQKRAQMGETAQEFTQNDVSRLCELEIVKAMCPSV